ncbi:MAG: isochorismatase family protein [Venatoribacter sp.]
MINKDDTGLIVVDVQGKLSELMHESQALFAQIKRLIQGANLFAMPVLAFEQLPEKLGATRSEIAQLLPTPALWKNTFSGLANPTIKTAISNTGLKKWLVVGIEAHVCVYQTVVDLLAQGHEVELVVDAISSRAYSNKEVAVTKMQALGAGITTTEMALFELQKQASGAEFKQFINIVK